MSVKRRGKSYEVRWRSAGVQHSRSFARHADAVAFELEAKRSAQLGAHGVGVPSREQLGAHLDAWWRSESPLWAASTRKQREDVLRRWVRPYASGIRLADLGSKRVAEWRADILRRGCPPTQANHALSVLSSALG